MSTQFVHVNTPEEIQTLRVHVENKLCHFETLDLGTESQDKLQIGKWLNCKSGNIVLLYGTYYKLPFHPKPDKNPHLPEFLSAGVVVIA